MKRSCGDCQVCCHLFHIEVLPEEVAITRWTDCLHQCEAGCAIHLDRPQPCRNFRCAWLDGWGEPEDRPDLLGMMIELREARPRLGVRESALATEARPAAAREERARTRLLELKGERDVVLVDYGARGPDTWGRALPDDF